MQTRAEPRPLSVAPANAGWIRRKCAACDREDKERTLGLVQRSASAVPADVSSTEVIAKGGRPLASELRRSFERRFGHDFSRVRIHDDATAARSAHALGAEAYTFRDQVVFAAGRYHPETRAGMHLLAHELAHVVQQARAQLGGGTSPMPFRVGSADDPHERQADAAADAAVEGRSFGGLSPALSSVQRRSAPYIKKVTVHLTPPQSADLAWEGTPPAGATGTDSFTVSTGKGYSDPGDPPGTCTRDCCSDPLTQCAPPYNQPGRVGACCTYYGNNFWTGTPLTEHNGWQWWTPIQPYYSRRGIALHAHPEVTGQPIGHGCVRMAEGNAKRIFDYSNGSRTNVTIEGRAAPVLCANDRRCAGASGATDRGATGSDAGRLGTQAASAQGEEAAVAESDVIPGQEGELS